MMMKKDACDTSNPDFIKTINMSIPQPSPDNTPWDNGAPLSPPCDDYNTILDEVNSRLGVPPVFNWQYLAHASNSIWSAPLGVEHLYSGWKSDPENVPFMVDPDAEQFVANMSSSNPTEPFAALTYITPCALESDHPETSGTADGPEWLAWVVNAIGQSKYWNSTAIIVVWDDWGGWYDHVPPSEPNQAGVHFAWPNEYNVSPDPNEWGFRVPFLVISPYVVSRGYISNQATSGFQYRSQSVILQFIEAVFGVASLGGDDYQQGQQDYLQDIFDMSSTPSPLPYVAVTEPPNWSSPAPEATCPANDWEGSYRRIRHGHPFGKALLLTPTPR
jgi:phospholipase C